MIHVDRTSVPVPDVLRTPLAEQAREEVREFFSLPDAEEDQRYLFSTRFWKGDVQKALVNLFAGKCAYCESPIVATAHVDIEHFRPKFDARGLDGSRSPRHYGWLAYEWSNLYPACPACNRMKGSRFPVRGNRAEPGTYGDALLAEQPLLLDPCQDDPEEHLVFDDSGFVASQSERGRVTIEVFNLNRSALVAARSEEIQRARLEWLTAIQANQIDTVISDVFATHRPYAAARRQTVLRYLDTIRPTVDNVLASTPTGPNSLDDATQGLSVVSDADQQKTASAFEQYQAQLDSYTVKGASHSGEYYYRTRFIDRVELENFKAIGQLSLGFASSADSHQSWMMLLGENGAGKSSILQALALTLIGSEYRSLLTRRYKLDASTFVRRGQQRGIVRVFLTGANQPETLEFRLDSPDFFGTADDPKILLLGYGATRLLPRGRARPPAMPDYARVDNLFNPFVPLQNARRWLYSLPDPTFDEIENSLRQLLQLRTTARLMRDRKRRTVSIEEFGGRVPLEQLSDGYQSVIALAADIMAVMLHRWDTMADAEGIVLIDEVCAHLHPRWRMRIVRSLRSLFPRVQFLGSTHDPLALRGLDNGEVAVLRRTRQQEIYALTDLPPVQGLRVDQLLTSEHFGLRSTIDPELDALFEEYYDLKAKRSRSPDEEARHLELAQQLDQFEVLGSTLRERLMLEAIDQFVAEVVDVTDGNERRERELATRREVQSIWGSVIIRTDGST